MLVGSLTIGGRDVRASVKRSLSPKRLSALDAVKH